MSVTGKVLLEPAWILHHYPYRDTSLLLEVFSREHGRLGLVARGARAAKSRWRGLLQGFQPLLLSWSQRGELGTLAGAELRTGMAVPAGRHLMSAWYLNELLLRLLTRHDPHPVLFDVYEQALRDLDTAEQPTLRIFEKHLLQELGYGLLLDHEAESGRPVTPDALYEYRLESGPVACETSRDNGLFLHGSSLLALHAEDLVDGDACREIKRLMRAVLSLYLGPRPLRTREVLRQMSSTGGGPAAPNTPSMNRDMQT
jgi:DNA repair protein RecO (recombination protein O)